MDLEKIKNRIIKDLQEEIPDFSQDNFQVRQLHSKKNDVVEVLFKQIPSKLPKELVIKIFRTENIVNEFNILNRLKNQKLKVPKILFFRNPYLILEKINGTNLCDFINENLRNTETLDDLDSNIKRQIIKSVESLAEFLASLHEKNFVRKRYKAKKKYVLCKGDTRLRDFIYNTKKDIIYAVDFEDAYEGNHLDDVAAICGALLDTDPGLFELEEPHHKIDLINIFLKKYYQTNPRFPFIFNYLAEKLIENLNAVIERRNLPYGTISKERIFKDISKEI
jgi:tRNA A-37 threonylcarbamoyl transferase component Bud32